MAKRNRLLPFGFRNFFAGLEGKSKERARAEYYYTGEDLEREMLKIETGEDHENVEETLSVEYQLEALNIDLKYERVTKEQYEYARIFVEKEYDEEYELKKLELDLKFKYITDTEYEKAKANILKEPWVKADLRVDPDSGVLTGHYDIDWNDLWIAKLISEGYGKNAVSDEEIIDQWLTSIHRSILMETEIAGDTSLSDYEPKRTQIDDDRAEYK